MLRINEYSLLTYARCFIFFADIFPPFCSSAATAIILPQLTVLDSVVAHSEREKE